MTDPTPDLATLRLQVAADLDRVARATLRLYQSMDAVDDAALGEASLLPGWTRAHVLAHVARNAEAMLHLVTWAVTGTPTPMYASVEAREEGIQSAARLPADALRALVRGSGEALQEGFTGLARASGEALDRLVLFGPPREGAVPDVPARLVPQARLREVEIHHLDLAAGYSPDDWPEAFVRETTAYLDTRARPTGVTGTPGEVLAWRLGRGAGASVRSADGGDPGEPPAW